MVYLPDPDIDGNWWPHPALEAQFWADGAVDVDAVHIHFGFEHRTPGQIAELVSALPVPLVLTVHDIDNPHLADQTDHHVRLRLLIDAAAAVITLTDTAADRLAAEFGARNARVVPHPRVVNQSVRATHGGGAGVFVKSLRANVVSDPDFYARIAAATPLTVFVHDVDATRPLREALAGAPGVELRVHEPFDDAELYSAVGSLDVCLLPYTRGTHSGWLEMCRDLGVTVAVPNIGCYAGQADTSEAVEVYAVGDAEGAAVGVDKLRARGPLTFAGDRDAQLAAVRRAHQDIYRAALR